MQCPAAEAGPFGCDTFVSCIAGTTVFGKNSDRPCDEVQNVVYIPGGVHAEGATVTCTYITIPQASRTYDVILCQPHWMWGAEMGANECGVVVGNEAVWARISPAAEKRLLGMDFVRLILERSPTAVDGVDALVGLLAHHGQGGPCSEDGDMTYHNSYLIADASEAWVVETVDRWWVAKRIRDRTRNISNDLSIRGIFDRVHPELLAFCRQHGWWDGAGPFNWKAAMDGRPEPVDSDDEVDLSCTDREGKGRAWLWHLTNGHTAQLRPHNMLTVLRDREAGISMEGPGFRSTASMVARLTPTSVEVWLTGTPDPNASAFKPFEFPGPEDRERVARDPVWGALRAGRTPDPGTLWWQHEAGGPDRAEALRRLEIDMFDQRGPDAFLRAVTTEASL